MTKPRAALKPRRTPGRAAVGTGAKRAPKSAKRTTKSGKHVSKSGRPRSEGRVVLVRQDGRQVRRTTIYMEVELAKRVGIHAVERGVDKTQIIQEALEEYLAKRRA